MQIVDVFTMTGSPEDEVKLLEEINLRLVAGANELLEENARLRAALFAIIHQAACYGDPSKADNHSARLHRIGWRYIELIAGRAITGQGNKEKLAC
jgi:hypothetical protein